MLQDRKISEFLNISFVLELQPLQDRIYPWMLTMIATKRQHTKDNERAWN